jgi:hypothetical protein
MTGLLNDCGGGQIFIEWFVNHNLGASPQFVAHLYIYKDGLRWRASHNGNLSVEVERRFESYAE